MLLTSSSSFSVDNNPAYEYNTTKAPQSSVTIFGGSLRANRSYLFAVSMVNRRNRTAQATGYVLVKIETTRPQMIAIE